MYVHCRVSTTNYLDSCHLLFKRRPKLRIRLFELESIERKAYFSSLVSFTSLSRIMAYVSRCNVMAVFLLKLQIYRTLEKKV